MYLCGSPGTGKTVTVDAVQQSFFQHKPAVCRDVGGTAVTSGSVNAAAGVRVQFVKINAMTLREPAQLYPVLLATLLAEGTLRRSGQGASRAS